jgi:hypothetical protein
MKVSRVILLGFCALILPALPASAFVASNGFRVAPDGPRSFVVPYQQGTSGNPAYWCAAGDFVVRALRLSPGTRVFRVTPPPVKPGGMRFSLDAKGAVKPGITVFGSKDAGLSAALAQVQCSNTLKDDIFGR